MTDELSDARLDEIEASLEHVTAGPWAYLACGEKDNSWQVGLWTRPDETAIEGEVNDDDAERYETAGFPDAWEEHAVCIETVCENVDAMASLSDASFIAESRTLVPRLVAALRSERTQTRYVKDDTRRTVEGYQSLADDLYAALSANETTIESLRAELERERTQNREAIAEMDRRLDVLQRFADVWLKTGNDDEQLCMAHDFFVGVLNPPRAALSTQEESK